MTCVSDDRSAGWDINSRYNLLLTAFPAGSEPDRRKKRYKRQDVEMGRFLNDFGVKLFEEPVPWQDYQGTQRVTRALSDLPLKVAGGEQDSNLWQWRAMTRQRTVDIVQPDIFYNGGFVRCLRVAKMAEAMQIPVTPHSPKVLPAAAANLHLCSVIPNLGPYQEYRSFGTVTDGTITIPEGPGLGIEMDLRH